MPETNRTPEKKQAIRGLGKEVRQDSLFFCFPFPAFQTEVIFTMK